MGTDEAVTPVPDQPEHPNVRRGRFEALVRDELAGPLHRYLVRRTDPATADDVLAETLLVCWRRFDEVPDRALPWAYGVARRCLANAQRTERRQQRVAGRIAVVDPPHETDEPPGARDDAVHDAVHEAVHEALSRLRPDDAELLRLWAWEQLGPSEIAEVLDVSANAVSIRLHRARARLREELGKVEAGAGHEESEGGRIP